MSRPGLLDAASTRTRWTVVSGLMGALFFGAFLYAYRAAETLPRDAGVFPRFVATIGLVLLALYLLRLVVAMARGRAVSTVAPSDPDGDALGVVKTYAITAAMFAGTWLIGFHLAIPLFVVLYLRRYAGIRYRVLVPTFLGFLALITIVYGNFMSTRWPASVLEDRYMARSLQRTLMPYFRPLLDLVGL